MFSTCAIVRKVNKSLSRSGRMNTIQEERVSITEKRHCLDFNQSSACKTVHCSLVITLEGYWWELNFHSIRLTLGLEGKGIKLTVCKLNYKEKIKMLDLSLCQLDRVLLRCLDRWWQLQLFVLPLLTLWICWIDMRMFESILDLFP